MKPKLVEPVLVSCLPWLYTVVANLLCADQFEPSVSPHPHPLPWHTQTIDHFQCPRSKAFDVKGLPEGGGFGQLPVCGGEFEPEVLGIHAVSDP